MSLSAECDTHPELLVRRLCVDENLHGRGLSKERVQLRKGQSGARVT